MKAEEIRKLLIAPHLSLKDAMKMLSSVTSKILFVTDDSDVLVGSLTDGDVRRAILNGMGFDKPVSGIMCTKPRFVRRSNKSFAGIAKRHILNERIQGVPVLDDADRISDILFWFDFFEEHPHEVSAFRSVANPVVIMAGGKGERLDPFTRILPKPLIPFGDNTIIERIMSNFQKNGFSRFILTLNYKKELIKMYFSENVMPHKIDYVDESEYLGTAGSLSLLKGKINKTFFVSNCDVILEHNFKNILLWHKNEKALITLIGCHKEMVVPYGALEVEDGKLKSISEKPIFDMIINTGIYVLEPKVLELISSNEKLDMNELIERAMDHGKVTIYPVYGGWFDLGQWKEYKDSLYLLQNSK